MSAPKPITEHVRLGLDDLIDQFKGLPTIEGILTSWLLRVQRMDGDIQSVFAAKTIEMATGASLDIFGRIVGEPRLGRSDAEYRTALRIIVKVNRSNGRLRDIVEILGLLGGSEPPKYREVYPAAFSAQLYGVVGLEYVLGLLERATAAGVSGEITFSVVSYARTAHWGSLTTSDFPNTYTSLHQPPSGTDPLHGSVRTI